MSIIAAELTLIDENTALRARVAKLESALKRLIADYEDVPDPTDADGQQVFIDARAALKDAPQ